MPLTHGPIKDPTAPFHHGNTNAPDGIARLHVEVSPGTKADVPPPSLRCCALGRIDRTPRLEALARAIQIDAFTHLFLEGQIRRVDGAARGQWVALLVLGDAARK